MKVFLVFAAMALSAAVTPAALAQDTNGEIRVVADVAGRPLPHHRLELRRLERDEPTRAVGF